MEEVAEETRGDGVTASSFSIPGMSLLVGDGKGAFRDRELALTVPGPFHELIEGDRSLVRFFS